jgi:hypothetical protein
MYIISSSRRAGKTAILQAGAELAEILRRPEHKDLQFNLANFGPGDPLNRITKTLEALETSGTDEMRELLSRVSSSNQWWVVYTAQHMLMSPDRVVPDEGGQS